MKKKKRKIFMIITAAVIMNVGILSSAIPVWADSRIASKGDVALEEEMLHLYSADFDRVQSELDGLYGEVPIIPDVEFYGTPRKSRLASKGNFDYGGGAVRIHAADFAYLADEIDLLEAAYKSNIMTALNAVGTFFLENGAIGYGEEAAASAMQVSSRIPFEKLYEGIIRSQSVAHLEAQQIYAAAQDNLSSGTAAWVNGKLLVGTGADNEAAYNRGYTDGFQKVMDGIDIVYEYHVHTGQESECSGCYQEGYHVHSGCPTHEVGTGRYIQCSFSNGDNNGGEAECPWHGTEYLYTVDMGSKDFSCCNYQTEIMETVYDCGYYDNCWRRNCGMTEDTIVKAEICFR